MAISFHCEYCGKKIEAQDSAGGKWAKCPSCHNKIYVPNLADAGDEELKLSPVDQSEEDKKKQLMAETYKLTQDIMQEREAPEGGPDLSSASEADENRLTGQVIQYLRYMADGELDQADDVARSITSSGKKALKIIDEIAVSDMPEPQLADIPRQVLSRLIKTLRARVR